jgi:hypothetical protein
LEMSRSCEFQRGYTAVFVSMGYPDTPANFPHHVVLSLNGVVAVDRMTPPGGGQVKLWDNLAVRQNYDVTMAIDGLPHSFRAYCP